MLVHILFIPPICNSYFENQTGRKKGTMYELNWWTEILKMTDLEIFEDLPGGCILRLLNVGTLFMLFARVLVPTES